MRQRRDDGERRSREEEGKMAGRGLRKVEASQLTSTARSQALSGRQLGLSEANWFAS